ncbi:MAG: DUF4160 domain-containing protein [Candidatus Protochlamydia sp.]|nr:DUF4160 domain-containing protein [Candidatus Protochlamydia sp.]
MPNIGNLFGIIFCMFCEIGAPHHKKHVLAMYGNYKANYDIETGRRINGNMPSRQERVINQALRENKEDFLNCWELLNQENSVTPPKIQFAMSNKNGRS